MMIYATIETIHQMKYMQPSIMEILLSILPSLLSYFMSQIKMFILIFNMKKPFYARKIN